MVIQAGWKNKLIAVGDYQQSFVFTLDIFLKWRTENIYFNICAAICKYCEIR